MHIISFISLPKMKVDIHNQCLDFELIERKCFSSDTDWNKHPDWRVDAGSIMSADLIPLLTTFGGVLTYVLQRKDIEPDSQLESTCIRLLVVWKSEGHEKFRVFIHLIEYDKLFYWDKFKPNEYYQRYTSELNTYTGPINDKWLMDDGTVLMTRLELDSIQGNIRLNIIISEGIGNDHARKPVWIDLKR
jgi:hypothetical protein